MRARRIWIFHFKRESGLVACREQRAPGNSGMLIVTAKQLTKCPKHSTQGGEGHWSIWSQA